MKALILAGGKGSRLWPISRQAKPKQFQCLLGKKTMLQETVQRLLPMLKISDIYISTNEQYFQEIRKELPKIPSKNVIVEPVSRERVAALLLFLSRWTGNQDEPILVMPSDHAIGDLEKFQKAIFDSVEFVKNNKDYFAIIGAEPNFPDTGLGYIKKGSKIKTSSQFELFQVSFFKEKPNLKRAKDFVLSKQYLWNTGIYVFYPKLLKDLIKKFVPDNFALFEKIVSKKIVKDLYPQMRSAGLEYEVLERYNKIAVLACDMGWSDVGTWSVLKNSISEGNEKYAKGNHISVDSQDVFVYGPAEKLVATIGVKDLIVVHTDDITLICKKNKSQKVKDVVEELKKQNKLFYI